MKSMKALSKYAKRQLLNIVIFMIFLFIYFGFKISMDIKGLIFIFLLSLVLTRINKKNY